MRHLLPRARARRVLLVLLALPVEVLIRTAPLPLTCRLLRVSLALEGPVGQRRTTPLPGWSRAALEAVDAAMSTPLVQDTCLRRALLTCVALRGLDPVLRLGWQPRPAPGNAHAWVEVQGTSLEDGLEGILPLSRRSA